MMVKVAVDCLSLGSRGVFHKDFCFADGYFLPAEQECLEKKGYLVSVSNDKDNLVLGRDKKSKKIEVDSSSNDAMG